MERSADGVLLETGRLVLRQFTMFDVDNLVTLDADPDVMRFITGGLATSRDEITRIAYNRRTRKSSKDIREAVSDRGRGVRSRGERPPAGASLKHRR